MSDAATEALPHRERCLACWRPTALCYCRGLPTVATKTRVVILQHPHERTHPFGSVRVARLCLPSATVHVPWAGVSGTLEHRVDVPNDAVVLFPRADATPLDALPVHERPSTIIALDGTWGHAKRLWRENPWLLRHRHVRLVPEIQDRYRIRKEPRPDYMSTIEAIVQALRCLEPDTNGLDDLLAAFDRMIDRQIEHSSDRMRHARRKLPRQRPSRAVSPLLAHDDLAVAYAESSLPGGVPGVARELVHWVAARLHGDEVFEAVIRPAGAFPSQHHLAHMELTAADLDAGEALDTARARFAAWLGHAPLAAWTPTTLAWGRAMIPPGTPTTALKTNYCNATNHSAGVLENVVLREGLAPRIVACRGRAGSRVGNALAAAMWLRDKLPR